VSKDEINFKLPALSKTAVLWYSAPYTTRAPSANIFLQFSSMKISQGHIYLKMIESELARRVDFQ